MATNKRRIGYLGIGGAVAAAAVILPAGATAGAGTTYDSTASATAGYVTVAGTQVPVPSSSVTARAGSGPQNGSVGLGLVEGNLGTGSLRKAIDTAAPAGASLITTSADAGADGRSSACAAILAGGCGGAASPLTISVSLADVPEITNLLTGVGGQDDSGAASGSSGGIVRSATGSSPLAGFKVVLSITGPEASCTAGPAGSGSGFTATQSLASVTLDVQDNGRSILPGGKPVQIHSGDVLSQLQVPALLKTAMDGIDTLPSGILSVTVSAGSTSGAGQGPVTTASTGDLGLSVEGAQVLDVTTAQATCGPDTPAAATATSPGTGPSGTGPEGISLSGPALTGSEAERPLGGGIATDEGRSRP